MTSRFRLGAHGAEPCNSRLMLETSVAAFTESDTLIIR